MVKKLNITVGSGKTAKTFTSVKAAKKHADKTVGKLSVRAS